MKKLPFLSWEVNYECNHNCTHCYNGNYELNKVCLMSDADLNAISDFLVSQQPVSVTISGGEALLVFDRLRLHIEKLRNHDICVRILSNGALITEEIARFCAKWDIHFLISFPSVDRTVFGTVTGQADSYEKVLAGMDLLQKYGVVFQPNVVVVTANLDTVEETVRFLWKRYSPPSVMVSRATAPADMGAKASGILLSSEQLRRMFDICVMLSDREGIPIKTCGGFALCAMNSRKSYAIFGKVCGGGKHDCVITSSGDVRVCARDSQVYGNIFRDSFDEIRGRMAEWRETPIPKACKRCRVAEICRGGCHMSSLEPNRGPGSMDCHARPQRGFFICLRRKRPKQALRPFHHYRVMPVIAVEEADCVRLSVGNAYDYFPPGVGDYLNSHREITLPSALRSWKGNAFPIMRKLLRIGAIQEGSP